MERIETVAIRINGLIFTLPRPNRHHNVFWWLTCLGVKTTNNHEQGFLTDTGRFVDRKEAAKIALSNGQVTGLISPPKLYSEDLWESGSQLPRIFEINEFAIGKNK